MMHLNIKKLARKQYDESKSSNCYDMTYVILRVKMTTSIINNIIIETNGWLKRLSRSDYGRENGVTDTPLNIGLRS